MPGRSIKVEIQTYEQHLKGERVFKDKAVIRPGKISRLAFLKGNGSLGQTDVVLLVEDNKGHSLWVPLSNKLFVNMFKRFKECEK